MLGFGTPPMRRQRREVDVRLDLGQRIDQGVDLLTAMIKGEQVGLDGAMGFHRSRLGAHSERCNFTKSGRGEVFEAPFSVTAGSLVIRRPKLTQFEAVTPSEHSLRPQWMFAAFNLQKAEAPKLPPRTP